MTDSSPSHSPLGRLGKFDLIRELGKGGMGVVYEAFDTALQRRCALKLMLPAPGQDPTEAKHDQDRFLREARLCANVLKNPFIVQVYEAGAAAGKHFFAMELIEGRSLAQWRKEGKKPLRVEVALLRDALLGIQHAHEQGVIHRDLKPENILVDREDRPHLVDFGLAKTDSSPRGLSLTASGAMMGTPYYMSPEQVRNAKAVDARTDIWSMGVVLFQTLSGQLPFTGDSAVDVLMKISKQVVPIPSSVLLPGAAREWDDTLERICLKALAKDPFNRYPSARDFASDLTLWLEGKEVQVAPPRRYTVYRMKKSHAVAGAATAATLVLLLGTLLLLRSGNRAAEARTRDALRAKELELLQKDQELKKALEEQARARVLPPPAPELPVVPPSTLPIAERPPEQTLRGHTDAAQALRFSTDGRWLISAGADGTVRRWSLGTAEAAFVAKPHGTFVRALDWSADGLKIASVDYDGRMFLLNSGTGTELRAFPKQDKYLEGVAFTPDGKQLATAGRDGKIKLWDAESAQELHALACGSRALAVAVSRNGRWLAGGGDTGEVRLWSLPSRAEAPMGAGHLGWIRWMEFDEAGDRLLVAGNHPVATVWSVRERKMSHALNAFAGNVSSAAISPDGTLAAAGSADLLRFWNAATGRELRTLTGINGSPTALAFSRDGKKLAAAGSDGILRIWSVAELLR